jgi:phospholipase/carboxylesterase
MTTKSADAAESYIYHAEGLAEGRQLAFVFHGTGGTETQFVPLMRELQPGTAIVAPRGDVNEGGALRFFRRLGMGRYDMADLATRTEAMAEFVEAHVAAAKPSEVIGLGYSNGANILASLIFARPTLFTKAVLMHPYIPWTPAPEAVTTEILITAGERDPICPPQATRDLDSWFRAQGTPVETAWEPGGHEISRGEISAIAQFLR